MDMNYAAEIKCMLFTSADTNGINGLTRQEASTDCNHHTDIAVTCRQQLQIIERHISCICTYRFVTSASNDVARSCAQLAADNVPCCISAKHLPSMHFMRLPVPAVIEGMQASWHQFKKEGSIVQSSCHDMYAQTTMLQVLYIYGLLLYIITCTYHLSSSNPSAMQLLTQSSGLRV